MRQHPFDELMELDAQDIRLDCAALHLARDEYPDVTLGRYLRLLDELADAVADRKPGLLAPRRFEAMREVLVDEFGLVGNREQFYDPQNSYLNRVLDTRRGIPITLALVWIEVGRRLKWPVSGVALPGHFIVRFDDSERFILVDPFHGGAVLSIDDCRELVSDRYDDEIAFRLEHLEPVGPHRLLARLLRNLRSIYLTCEDLPRLRVTLKRLAAVEPDSEQHLQDIAAVCTRQGDVRGAFAHLQLYLKRLPDGRDSKRVRRNLRQLRAALLALN